MNTVKKLASFLGMGVLLTVSATPTHAIPGQTTDQAAAWIQAHPTLRPGRGEKFFVRKIEIAAQKFSFEASLLPPGRLKKLTPNANLIRNETFTLFDMLNGVTLNRLRESLRAIYGLDLAQDFDRAKVLYTYPSDDTIEQAVRQNNAQIGALQGELRQGDRYAYWLEIAQTPEGYAYSGRFTVFLKDDVDKLEAELRNP